MSRPSGAGNGVPGVERVAALLDERAPDAPRLRQALGLVLAGGRHSIPRLVRRTGLSRRLLLDLLRSVGPDVRWDGETVRFVGTPRAYAELIEAVPRDDRAPPRAAIERMRRVLDRAPEPLRSLDHVPATAETVLRRAQYVAREFDLDRTRLLLVGDHDCTSLAFDVLGLPLRSATVVDVDERLLDFIATEADAGEAPIATLFADLRLGLPRSARRAHDLVLTDPPYTPDGVGLFVARGVEGLEEPAKGRILVAYGLSESTPALGLGVQRALGDLDLLFEAILPDFNRYDGAQAIGSRADLYRLRPTRRTPRLAQRAIARAARTLYTRGAQAEESAAASPAHDDLPGAVLDRFGQDGERLLVGARWPAPSAMAIERFLGSDAPPASTAATTLVDLRPWFGWSIVRAALTAASDRAIVIAPNDAHGLRSRTEQARLRDALAPRYDVEALLRSFDGTDATVVVLRRRADDGSVAAHVWSRPHGRLANTWREGLIAAARRRGATLTKNQARAVVERTSLGGVAGHRLLDLPAGMLVRLQAVLDDPT